MTELLIQPKLGTLTRISEPIEGKVYVMCFCGVVLGVNKYDWADGVRRPQTCKRCSIRRRRRFSLTKREPVAAVGPRR